MKMLKSSFALLAIETFLSDTVIYAAEAVISHALAKRYHIHFRYGALYEQH
jgi:hypothetical protein